MITLDTINEAFHAISIKDSTNSYELDIDANGYITAKINGSVVVTATDLDIRALTNADVVTIEDGGGSITVDGTVAATQSGTWSVDLDAGAEVIITDGTDTLAIDASGFITANINGTVAVSATDLDIRDLTHVSDSVQVGDGTDLLAVNADGSINVLSAPAAFDVWKTSVVAASTTVAEIAATPLANRLRMIIQNLGGDVYIGEDNGVVVGDGILLPKGSSMEFPFGATANVWAITASGTSNLRILEAAL